MNVSLVDVDSKIPNFALMKLSAWHKKCGDSVEWYSPLFSDPDVIYVSKIFTFTPDYMEFNPNHPEPIKGGTGYGDYTVVLPDEAEKMLPDYSIYNVDENQCYGFLSRGCIRKCHFCIVPKKEGTIRQYDDVARISENGKRKICTLFDNNFLANDFEFVKEQCEKMKRLKLRVDFNQQLDCRLVTEEIQMQLENVKFQRYMRFSDDDLNEHKPCLEAISRMQKHGVKQFMIYVLARETETQLWRAEQLISHGVKLNVRVDPFIMPYRDFTTNSEPEKEIQMLQRWCNRVEIRKSCRFNEYKNIRKK